MAEYTSTYPSSEGDDSNKSSSELLAEILKPNYVPQELMLAWETHLASYDRDTSELLEQVKDSENTLNTKYQALLARVQKYEQMLQDITMDSNEFTMDTDEVNFTGWNILAQASYWDYLLRKEITKLSDTIKSSQFKGELVTEVSSSVLENIASDNTYMSNVIDALTDTPLIQDLDAALSNTSTDLSDLRAAHEALKAKQYADALALADQNQENIDKLQLTFNTQISAQIDRIAEEAAARTRSFEELANGITSVSESYSTGQEIISNQILTLKSSTDSAIAGIEQNYSTIAGTNEAITSALNTYSAKVDSTISTILTDYVSYANLDAALVSKSDMLLAIVNDNIAQLNITNQISSSLTSVRAVSTVTVDVNGVVSGYGLISELENGTVTSAFGVNADTFYIGKPTDSVKPFVVTTKTKTIDGISYPAGTWINTAIIANATIGTAHIKDASITNAKVANLDASKITTGVLNANLIRVGSTSTFDEGYNPTTKARTFVSQPTVPYSEGDIWKDGSSTYICKQTRVAGSFTASEWDKVGDVTSENTALDVTNVNGVSAATVATNAANGALVYSDVMSDLKITPVEKTAINQEWNRIQKEYASLLVQAQSLSLSTTAYTAAYTGLSTTDPAMSTILSSMSTTTTLTSAQRDAYNSQCTDYYTQAMAITKAINDQIAANAKANVDNLNIGGTNLLNGTALPSVTSRYLSTGIQTLTRTATTDAYKDVYPANISTVPVAIEAGEYTLSFYAKADKTLDINSYFHTPDNTTKAVASNGTTSTSSNGMIRFNLTTDWQKYWVTWTTGAADTKNIVLGRLQGNNIGTVQFAMVKFEKGNRATDWTPSPSDVQNGIDNAASVADSKSKTFTAQPTTPYKTGDIWRDGSSIKVCTTTRNSGSFVAADWTLAGDVTSANTAANANQLGGTPAATINTNIANADAKATDANNQINAWKFTGTTEIDGGRIRADTITAAQLSVNELSAISANLGTLITYKDPNKPTGARMVMSGSLITVYDDNNRVRVKLGLW